MYCKTRFVPRLRRHAFLVHPVRPGGARSVRLRGMGVDFAVYLSQLGLTERFKQSLRERADGHGAVRTPPQTTELRVIDTIRLRPSALGSSFSLSARCWTAVSHQQNGPMFSVPAQAIKWWQEFHLGLPKRNLNAA